MPEWYQEAVKTLLQLYREDRDVFTVVQLAIKAIKKNPLSGEYIQETYRVYIDPERRFRIGYNFHSEAKDLEIVVIHILKN